MRATSLSKQRWPGLGALVLVGLTATVATALDPGQWHGNIDVTAVSGEVGANDRRTVKQDYRAQWDRLLFPNLQLRGSYRYYRFDLDEATSSFRRETRPEGSLSWNHPAFSLNLGAARREARTSQTGNDLIADDLGFSLRTRSNRYPTVGLRVDSNQLSDRGTMVQRDTRDRRFQGNVDHTWADYALGYAFTYRMTSNWITDLETRQRSHLLRLGRASRPILGKRLRVGAHYTFSYRNQEDERSGDGGIHDLVPVGLGLYLEDPSPEQDRLEPVGGLIDGDSSTPTDPVIDIGGALVDRNLGADLRFERTVDTVYLYTDRPAGTVSWRVYSSPDNLNWDLVDSAPRASFNNGRQRYEIAFTPVRTRFLKVVNGGLNPSAEVFVTEIEVLAEVGSARSATRIQRNHVADVDVAYRVSESLSTRASLNLQHDPPQGGVGSHLSTVYLLGTHYRQSPVLEHDLRWEQGYQFFDDADEDLVDQSASYALRFDPWPTLGLTVGATHRTVRLGGEPDQEDNNGSIQLRGTPVRGLGLDLESSRSRNLQYRGGRRSDSWHHRVSSDLTFSRSLTVTASAGRQSVRSNAPTDTRVRNRYRTEVELRPTRTLRLRGAFHVLDDERVDSTQREGTLAWNLSPKLTATGSISRVESSGGLDTRRYDSTITYRMSPRSSVYFQTNRVDFSGAGGADTATYQVGVRTGF